MSSVGLEFREARAHALVLQRKILLRVANGTLDTSRIFSFIANPLTLMNAYRQLRRRKTGPRSTGVIAEELGPKDFDVLSRDLKSGDYRPAYLRERLIPKVGGGIRRLLIPSARDKTVQRAVANIVAPIVESHLPPNVYAFRSNKGGHEALNDIISAVVEGPPEMHAVECDVREFFDSIEHALLLQQVEAWVPDRRLLRLVKQILHTKVRRADGAVLPRTIGIAQGSPLSPVLSNIFLAPLDRWLSQVRAESFRYADDLLLLTPTKELAEGVSTNLQEFLSAQLKLRLHVTKIAPVDHAFEFVGFRIRRERSTT